MESIYDKAKNGTLNASDLVGKEKELNAVDPKSKLTPLGVAAWNGHYKQVRMLLQNGADPNGVDPTGTPSRPPLWVAASRTKNNAGQIVQVLLHYGADPSKPSEFDENAPPLLGAVKRGRSQRLITALVDAGASPEVENNKGESAREWATTRKDRKILAALIPSPKRSTNRLDALLLLSGLMLFIVAWVNEEHRKKAVAAGALALMGGVIKQRFDWSGLLDNLIPESLRESKNVDQFREDILKYITDTHLDHDSGSMIEGSRMQRQNELCQQITSITTRLVPDNEGIELRFINKETESNMSKPSLDTINDIMMSLDCDGWTEIGTNLKKKILEELVYKPLRNGTFKRPVLVSIITDGCPMGPSRTPERHDTLKKTILECGQLLQQYGYSPKVVRFQISQIGTDRDARDFLIALDSDPDLREVLYCTAQRLDTEFEKWAENEWRLEQWLLQLLMGPIMDADAV
ncbi:hypothetical protein PT974_03562 [Cladobotryum mycophilum]|uniref:Ankyrin repeat protein n=1 Tax=Cladobotryum mycophilum TaxID=491253 RepID=A0ABR0STU0_9HYPO